MRIAILLVAVLLSWIAIERTDFSLSKISAPLMQKQIEVLPFEIEKMLSQPFHYLGQGRQAFVFVSEDGKVVLKFFNAKYLQMPWYGSLPFWKDKETLKRQKRREFYAESYLLAQERMKEETGILYVHLGKTDRPLTAVSLKDKASRLFQIDLNQIPFVLQKRGEPFYPKLTKENLSETIDSFLQLIAKRISYGIADADHDVEHNFGWLEGKLLHLDPGRFSLLERLDDPKRIEQEWWSATHRFRLWLQKHHPECISFFDAKRNDLQEMVSK